MYILKFLKYIKNSELGTIILSFHSMKFWDIFFNFREISLRYLFGIFNLKKIYNFDIGHKISTKES